MEQQTRRRRVFRMTLATLGLLQSAAVTQEFPRLLEPTDFVEESAAVAPELPRLLEPTDFVKQGTPNAPAMPQLLESADFGKQGAASVYELPLLLESASLAYQGVAPQPPPHFEPADLGKFSAADMPTPTENFAPTIKLQPPPVSYPESWESPWTHFPSIVQKEHGPRARLLVASNPLVDEAANQVPAASEAANQIPAASEAADDTLFVITTALRLVPHALPVRPRLLAASNQLVDEAANQVPAAPEAADDTLFKISTAQPLVSHALPVRPRLRVASNQLLDEPANQVPDAPEAADDTLFKISTAQPLVSHELPVRPRLRAASNQLLDEPANQVPAAPEPADDTLFKISTAQPIVSHELPVRPRLRAASNQLVEEAAKQVRPAPEGTDDIVIKINTAQPTVADLFRLESEAQFRARLTKETERFRDRVHIPEFVEPFSTKPLARERGWPLALESAESGRLCFFRLGFAQPWSERYGRSLGPLQPFLSAGLFYGDVAAFPLRALLPPWTLEQCDDLNDLSSVPWRGR